MSFSIRQLQPDDWKIWKKIRLEALQNHPEAFGASYNEYLNRIEDDYRANLRETFVLGAFAAGALVGTARFNADRAEKQKHRGYMTAVYLKKEHRGRGIAGTLIEGIAEHARGRVIQLHCGVAVENTAAVKLYERHGFMIYGTEPRTIMVDGKYYDEYFMVRVLD